MKMAPIVVGKAATAVIGGMIAVLFFVQKVALMCVTKLIEHVYVNHTLPAKHVRPVNAESMEANVTQIVPEDV
ncbi:hypothetical protein DPMN_069343 [Dreissena polymorpha]|uniref:Uncharacterized protein n=1 Tax=Dreissena polymorpha TaxID=45954 RepID=A0A9D4BX01_DREPO|nr:hypothetical protein DPMN_069343 [Dreissena polymorpha]